MSGAAKRAAPRVSRLDAAAADRLFPNRRSVWPSGYLPASGVAHFLNPNGVAFRDVVETRLELKEEDRGSSVIQRDFASDYGLWMRSQLDDLMFRAKECPETARIVRKVTNRERLCPIGTHCRLWNLANPADVDVQNADTSTASTAVASATGGKKHAVHTTEVLTSSGRPYGFNSYAALQEFSALPIRDCRGPDDLVHFSTYQQLRNCLYLDFDSCSALKALSMICGDGLVYSQDFVIALATYLRARMEDLKDDALDGGAKNEDGSLRRRPILTTFGNGRLAWLLNASCILPAPVIPTALPKPLLRKRLSYKFPENAVSPSFHAEFPCETIAVGDALEKYKPCLVLAEPHVDRDYSAELRGFHTVREVLMLGQIDSPAMGSFTFPLLTWGVSPGPSTYWVFNDSMQRATTMRNSQTMPMDPPYVAQGYSRCFVDDISNVMLHPNDCAALQNQSRCLAFRRVEKPRDLSKRV